MSGLFFYKGTLENKKLELDAEIINLASKIFKELNLNAVIKVVIGFLDD